MIRVHRNSNWGLLSNRDREFHSFSWQMAAQHLKSKGKDDFISWQETCMLFSPSSMLQICHFRSCAVTRALFWSPQQDVWVHYSYTLAPPIYLPSHSSLMCSSRASKQETGLQTNLTQNLPGFTISITKASAVSVEHTTNGITPHCTIHNSKALPCCGLTVPCISHNLYLQLVVTEDTLQMWSALNSAKRELY